MLTLSLTDTCTLYIWPIVGDMMLADLSHVGFSLNFFLSFVFERFILLTLIDEVRSVEEESNN